MSKFSLVVYSNNKLQILPEDYTGMGTDGIKNLFCISVHDSYKEAHAAMENAKQCREEDNA